MIMKTDTVKHIKHTNEILVGQVRFSPAFFELFIDPFMLRLGEKNCQMKTNQIFRGISADISLLQITRA